MARTAEFDRDDVIARARDLFWQKGYHATSMRDLGAALDLRPGSIYAAFGSKEGLFAAALDAYAADGRAALQAALAEAEDPLAGLALHVCRLAKRPAPARACMISRAVLDTGAEDPALRAHAEQLMSAVEAGFAAAFHDARDAGLIDPAADPGDLATRLQARILGMRAYLQRAGGPARAETLARDIVQWLDGLRRP